ncbi:hypothetical protein JNW88_31240 [Micromonospora sp. ATA32]|nr:hypothetical protein [Micromonospora sp. ATA32]
MTLRGRLTAAFLTVVLGPVLLGAFFVGSTMAAVDRSRSTERLGLRPPPCVPVSASQHRSRNFRGEA